MNQTYNLVEFFSGIGSQARALENLNVKINTLATCEWDIHAFVAYDAIHNSPDLDKDTAKMEKPDILEILKDYTLSNDGKQPMEYSMLKTYSVEALRYILSGIRKSNNLLDISSLKGTDMPENIDILTYSFPCQDLSNVGAFHGYNKGIDKNSNSRSSLLWQVGRILQEMKKADKTLPRFLVMENVPALLSKRHSGNFGTWINDLKELGYFSRYFQLNAFDFGLPQNRPRLLMLSIWVGDDEELHKDKDFNHIKRRNVEFHKGSWFFPRDKIIRMAGNSIPVKLLEGIFWLMIQTDKYLEDYKNGCA